MKEIKENTEERIKRLTKFAREVKVKEDTYSGTNREQDEVS